MGEKTMTTITTKRLEKILISLIQKIDTDATNIRVNTTGTTSMIKVDHIYKGFPELDKLNVDWVSFGKNSRGNLFYHVDGLYGRHFFGEQEYCADLAVAWSFVQQELYKYDCHSESWSGYDGSVEEISDGTNLTQKDLEENVFDRNEKEGVHKAYMKAFYNDFPDCRTELDKLEECKKENELNYYGGGA